MGVGENFLFEHDVTLGRSMNSRQSKYIMHNLRIIDSDNEYNSDFLYF